NILSINNVLGSDDGSYVAVVSNPVATVTSIVATLTVRDPTITLQPVSQSAVPGGSVSFLVGFIGSPSTSFTWYRNNQTVVGTNSTLSLTGLTGADAGTYFVVVSNAYGIVVSSVAILSVNYAAADSLGIALSASGCGNPAPIVDALAIQPDGEILMG